jgi:hypothetical protein
MRFTTVEIFCIALFLLAWTAVEAVVGTGVPSQSAPGTTYHAAAEAGAKVTSSKLPSALEEQPVQPAPAPRS